MKPKAALACTLIICGFLLCGCNQAEQNNSAPERISLYIEQESRIVTMDYAEYLTGCIFAAADPSFQHETLLAVGIACSGQAMCCIYGEKNDRSGWFGADLAKDAELCPEWLSPEQLEQEYSEKYEEYREKIADIAAEAARFCPYYNGEPADTVFCRLSSGVTDDGGQPYLPSLKLPADRDSRYYSCSVSLTEEIVRKSISAAVGSVSLPADREQWFSDEQRAKSGRIVSIKFGGVEFSGEQLRRALELRSTNIDIEYAYGTFTFRTLGEGNNVGMSIYTAEMLARSGNTADEILEKFYPGIELNRIN